jgi:putative oxidoreductase
LLFGGRALRCLLPRSPDCAPTFLACKWQRRKSALTFGIVNWFIKLLTPVQQSSWLAEIILAIPRVLTGLLLFRLGWSKFPTPEWFIEDVGKLGFPWPWWFAGAAVLAEVFGSVLLACGLLTRVAATFIGCTMLVAIFLQKANAPLWEKLPAIGFLWVAVYALVLGSGRLGFDSLLARVLSRPTQSLSAVKVAMS